MARDHRADSPQRTDAEREQARLERERRRAGKTGVTVPSQPPLPPPRPEAAPPTPEPRIEPEPAIVSAPVPMAPEPDPRLELGPLRPRRRRAAPRPHLPHHHRTPRSRAQGPQRHSLLSRLGALLAIAIVLVALAGAAALLLRHRDKPKPPPVRAIVKVTIPEGYTRAQIAALAQADGLRGSYLAASKSSTQLRMSRYGAPKRTSTLEGFLFPATYEMYAHAPASQLVATQLETFAEHFGSEPRHRARDLGVTPYQLLIVASIIEREAELPHDRSRVAAVIYNRLRLDMTLGIDSTLRYALKDFTRPLTESELHSDSPYNTRVHKGLPPTPISNPGDAAIYAAAHPAHVSYLYYVSGADGCGEQVFSTSYAKFERDAAAYDEAIRRNGGRVPTCRKH